jgi:hypothetical protein
VPALHLIKTWHRLFLGYYDCYEFRFIKPPKAEARNSSHF